MLRRVKSKPKSLHALDYKGHILDIFKSSLIKIQFFSCAVVTLVLIREWSQSGKPARNGA